jgi:hypothetical protein
MVMSFIKLVSSWSKHRLSSPGMWWYIYICIWTLQAVQWMDFLEDANLSIKEGSLCCFVLQLWDPRNRDASDCVLGVFGKLSTRRGAWVWFHDVCTCCAKVLEYWVIFSLKMKLNRSWKFRRNWNMCLMLLERSWWAGFNGKISWGWGNTWANCTGHTSICLNLTLRDAGIGGGEILMFCRWGLALWLVPCFSAHYFNPGGVLEVFFLANFCNLAV